MRKFLTAAALGCALLASGCTSIASAVSSLTIQATTATPSQATTLAEAEQAATLVEQALDTYVTAGSPSPAVLQQMKILVTAVHNTLIQVEQANAAGNSALTATALGAFNQALAAYNSYATLEGVKT